ncbi:HAD family hydrolase [Atopococcus tabaci]|uniref:HAD family hydrolase n=1 Tax=Atopococcus tabaci TaxID=269774 RepID=UPI000410A804|nr:HAD hydrolase-like protein [Atopococcus tabaci]
MERIEPECSGIYSNVAIVISANSEALYSEWERHGLLEHVDVVYGQETGTKAAAIEQLKTYGFANDEVLMVGDAPGDLKAAQVNDVLYYPILFGNEEKSWIRLSEEGVTRFLNKEYAGEYQEKVITEFEDLLKSYS